MRTIVAVLCASALALGAARPVRAEPGASPGDGWQAEFEQVCGRTQDAMSIPTDELHRLVARCDALRPAVAALDESARKVWERRLTLCRELYAFVLETREREGR